MFFIATFRSIGDHLMRRNKECAGNGFLKPSGEGFQTRPRWRYGRGIPCFVACMVLQALLLLAMPLAVTAAFVGERQIPPEEQAAFGGVIITTDGLVVPVLEFLSPLKDTYIQGQQDGQTFKFRPSDLREILLLEPGCPYGLYLHGGFRGCTLQITDRAGRLIRLSNADFTPQNVEENGLAYRVLNRATGRIETRALRPAEIAVIRLEGPVTNPGE
jgi:hypothetical protein